MLLASTWWWWPLRLGVCLVLLLPRTAVAQPADEGCVGCHVTLDAALSAPARALADDVHASSGFGCADCHGGDGEATDRETAKGPGTGYLGVPVGQAAVERCGGCHADAELMRRFLPAQRVDQLAEYAVSGHGLALAAGEPGVATCVSCHGAHGVRPVSDPRSPVFPTEVAATCGGCHADPAYMAPHERDGAPFPTDQAAAYERSRHFEALTTGHDLYAPTCNDCHGNHGAVPPGVDAVVNVCGTCHRTFADRYQDTVHAFLFERGCAECHDQHATVVAADDRLAVGPALCRGCHVDGDTGLVAAGVMGAAIARLRSTLDRVEQLVERASHAGMEMSEQDLALDQARTVLVLSRTEVHTFDPAAVTEVVDEGLAQLSVVEEAGHLAMAELSFRRRGLVLSLGVILLFVVALTLKVRDLDRHLPLNG